MVYVSFLSSSCGIGEVAIPQDELDCLGSLPAAGTQVTQ